MPDMPSFPAMTAADFDRPQLPVNIEAEQALLGALLVIPASYERVCGFLRPEHFGNAVHARIYGAIGKLVEEGAKPDPVLVKDMLGEEEVLVPLGGAATYVAKLIAAAGPAANAAHYAKAIIEA